MPARIAIVTGAAQGIGRGIALRLAKDGLDVVANDLPNQQTALDDLVKEIKALGRQGLAVTGDASEEADVENLVAVTVKELGGVDVFVANAGMVIASTFAESTNAQWDKMMNVNARGVYLGYRIAANQMVKQGRGGRIIGACSIAGKRGSSKLSLYCASKFAVRGLTQAAASEYGPYGITVNAYAPGFVATPFLRDLAPHLAAKGEAPGQAHVDQYLEGVKQNTPMRSLGTPEDIAPLVSYLASEESKFVTGQAINVNGGTHFD